MDGDTAVHSIPAVSVESLLDKTLSKYCLIIVSNVNKTGDPDVPT